MMAQSLLPLAHGFAGMVTSCSSSPSCSGSSCSSQQRQGGFRQAPLGVSSGFARARRLPQLWQLGAAPGQILGVEPDLVEDYVNIYMTAGEDTEEESFEYGKADGAHTWHEGDHEVDLVALFKKDIKELGGPNDHPGQAVMSWLYLPVIFSGMAFGVNPDYLFILSALFIFAFIGIEMAKPPKPSEFEPEIAKQSRLYE